MLAMLCSKPQATKAVMGKTMTSILLVTERAAKHS
ncbi:unnamed protein product, partial [marine sediment metagenome]